MKYDQDMVNWLRTKVDDGAWWLMKDLELLDAIPGKPDSQSQKRPITINPNSLSFYMI